MIGNINYLGSPIMLRVSLIIVLISVLSSCKSALTDTQQDIKLTRVEILSTQQSWTSTGLTLAAFDEVTISAAGKIDAGLPHPLEP
ncbi:MAG: hypothetical protein ACI90G_001154, partial [Urechidicola sp.]